MPNSKTNIRQRPSRAVPFGGFDLQALERRTLMAADPLTAVVSRGLLTITATAADDAITVSRSGNDWTIKDGDWSKVITAVVTKLMVNAKAGNDTVLIEASANVPATLMGDLGNDTLTAAGVATSLNGGAGNDSLAGGVGNDTLNGEAGNDTLAGGDGDNKLLGGADNDALSVNNGKNWLQGDGGNDVLNGGDGANTLLGGLGNDAIAGGASNDSIQGGLGSDTLSGGGGIDTIDYTDHNAAQPVWLDLKGSTEAGMTGENDTVADDFEVAIGGAGADRITSNTTGATLRGMAGNDTLNGGDGADVLYGDAGNDALSGWAGQDSLYGGTGDDLLQGGADEDLLVTVGGGKKSVLVGNDGVDTFWTDADVTENIADVSEAETAIGAVHRVATFANKAAKDLTGQNLADPTLKGSSVKYRNFKNRPIFAADGPTIGDITQGQIGDCYFLAQLGAYATKAADLIKQSIVNFGDGTYGIQFSKNGTKTFYRVDADLPSYSDSMLSYAALGAQGSMWVALFEKAWTFARSGKNTYASIEGGFMTEVASAFGRGSQWGTTKADPNTVLATLKAAMENNQTVTVGTTGSQPSGSLLVGSHAYTVVSIDDNGAGSYNVVLRNPWAIDGYTCADGDQDGYVTLTAEQFSTWTASYAIANT